MSELHNPLFEEEKEFLERKKLEYERALRGDVDHLKDQSVKVGKVALVGAGLAGGIWLITKAMSGKKRKRHDHDDEEYDDYNGFEGDEPDNDYEFGAQYFTAGNGRRYPSKTYHKSAADSANAFMAHEQHAHESDDLGFGSAAPMRAGASQHESEAEYERAPSPFDTEDFEDDPFQDLPYDDSRRLPTSHAFDDGAEGHGMTGYQSNGASKLIGSAVQAFLQSDTGKVLVAQVAAVALAVVTKKLSEFFPPAKNADLATSPGYAPAETGFSPVASLASPDFKDASNHSQSL